VNVPRLERLRTVWSALPPTLAGILLMVLSTALFATMHAGVRHASAEMHPFQVAFFRNLFGVLVVVPWLLRFGLTVFRTTRFPMHAFRAGLNLVAMLLFFSALSITELARVQALGFTAPLFASVFALLLLGERIAPRRSVALVVGFAGTLVVLRPTAETVDTGALLVLASAAVWAVAMTVIKSLSRTDSSVTITAWMLLMVTPMSLVPALFVWQTPDFGQFLVLALVGISGTMAQLAMTESLRVADATAVLPFDFMKLVWGSMLGFLLFAEIPALTTWIGGAMIFAGAMFLALRERGAAPASPPPGPPSSAQ